MTRRRAISIGIAAFVLLLIPVVIGTGIGNLVLFGRNAERPEVHHHQWGQWGQPQEHDGWIQFRSCTNCGVAEMRHVQWGK